MRNGTDQYGQQMVLPQHAPRPSPRPLHDADVVQIEPRPYPAENTPAQHGAPVARNDYQRLVADYEANQPTNSWIGNALRGAGHGAAKALSGLFRANAPLAESEVEMGDAEYQIAREALADDPAMLAEFEALMSGDMDQQQRQRMLTRAASHGAANLLEDAAFGYEPRTTWEDVKAAPARNVLPFVAEVSLPDMLMALTNAPLYTMSLAGRVAQARARNNLPQPLPHPSGQ